MAVKAKDQADILKAARKALGMTNPELAAALGKSQKAIETWLAPAGAAMRRQMPEGSKLLLARILADAKRKK